MKILGTGLSGLVGSRIVELLGNQHKFISIEADIRSREQIDRIIAVSKADILLHLAAKTDVDACEKEKNNGVESEAWQVNVLGTKNLIDACRKSGKKIVYVSTDFVFAGNIQDKGYSEEDKPHPVNWYGVTKYEGEKIVLNSNLPFMILRIAYPYRCYFSVKKDFVGKIIDTLKKGQKVITPEEGIMTPTFVDDLANAFNELIISKQSGIYHVVGSQWVSPYDAAILIAQVFKLDKSLIHKTARGKFFKNKAPRPLNLSIKNDKIKRLGIKMRSFEEGLIEVRRQLEISK